MADMLLEYDAQCEDKVQYPYYRCPKCENTFYGGGRAIHARNCPLYVSPFMPGITGYGGVCMVITPAVVKAVREYAEGNEDFMWHGVSLAMLREKLPEALES